MNGYVAAVLGSTEQEWAHIFGSSAESVGEFWFGKVS